MEENLHINVEDLPITLCAKYLGQYPAKGLWGMKHTRKPIDHLVGLAKALPANKILPIVHITIHKKGIAFRDVTDRDAPSKPKQFTVDCISYGVQDIVYTHVFSMIVVQDEDLQNVPFMCHSFLCESKIDARKITYALSAAFQEYSEKAKAQGKVDSIKKKFAIDLRTQEEIERDEEEETEA